MQVLCFPNISEEEAGDMAIKEGRIENIEVSVRVLEKGVTSIQEQLKEQNKIAQRVASLEGQLRPSPKVWKTALLPIFVGLGVAWLSIITVEIISNGRQLASLQGQTNSIEKLLLLSQAASDPTSITSINEARNILSDAKNKGIRMNPDVVKTTGDRFIRATVTQPAAWQTVQQYLGYRSFLNTRLAPFPTNMKPVEHWDRLWVLHTACTPNQGEIHFNTAGPTTTPDKSARIEVLSEPRPISNGPEWMVIRSKNCKIMLDDQLLKNVIIQDFHVEYRGGPTVLENVYFVNCTFDLQPGTNQQQLGQAILAATSVTFKSTS